MSNGKLTFWIDNREVLPVRAIPYVTNSPRFKPDILARRFAGDFCEEDIPPKYWALSAYLIIGDVSHKVRPGEWVDVIECVDGFQAGLRGKFFTPDSAYAVWSYGGAAALPAGWYVIYDEFLAAFQVDLENIIVVERRKDELNISPIMDTATRAFVMEGFEWYAENQPVEAQREESSTAVASNSPDEVLDESLAGLFEPVTPEVLEKMFPSGNKWSEWAERATQNGLANARDGRRRFNPYKAGIWFLGRGIPGWDTARFHKKLAENLPARSKDKKHLLIDDLD